MLPFSMHEFKKGFLPFFFGLITNAEQLKGNTLFLKMI